MSVYPIDTAKEARNPDLAHEWVNLVLSDEGQGVLAKYGFMPG